MEDERQIKTITDLRHIVEHDKLTGLYNRSHLFENTEAMVKQHSGESIAFIRIDINRFRLINSFLGERGGDDLLMFLANEVEKLARRFTWSVYGHVESDTFALCIPYDKRECEEGLENLIKNIIVYNTDYSIEPACGIYIIQDYNMSTENMYVAATLAANECKNKCMIYISYYNEKMADELSLEREITQDMQHALDNGEFTVYFQPKYNTQTKTPYGAEALVRWIHPVKGIIPPSVFIPLFESNGFIGKLDYYVWDKVCGYIRRWLDDGVKLAPISVNMSRAELTNTNLVNKITEIVNKYQIPPRLLQLELTESAYMDNPDAMNLVIYKLHKAGFTILMDDFGSGFSSLNTLKEIDVDILKIDMKFLSLDETNTKSKKILASVITMAQWIGLPVITEGVESREQYNFLQSIGCEYIQGYFFSKPVPFNQYDYIVRNTEAIEAKYSVRTDDEYMIPKSIKDKIYKDELTGTYNRRYLSEWLFLDIDNDNRQKISLGLILLDMKEFKRINDIRGHLVGDETLVAVSKALLNNTRKSDAVVRFGGDEFIIILTNCSQEIVKRRIDELRKAISEIHLREYNVTCMADFGYAYTEDFIKDQKYLLSMIREADQMMYSEKRKNIYE